MKSYTILDQEIIWARKSRLEIESVEISEKTPRVKQSSLAERLISQKSHHFFFSFSRDSESGLV